MHGKYKSGAEHFVKKGRSEGREKGCFVAEPPVLPPVVPPGGEGPPDVLPPGGEVPPDVLPPGGEGPPDVLPPVEVDPPDVGPPTIPGPPVTPEVPGEGETGSGDYTLELSTKLRYGITDQINFHTIEEQVDIVMETRIKKRPTDRWRTIR